MAMELGMHNGVVREDGGELLVNQYFIILSFILITCQPRFEWKSTYLQKNWLVVSLLFSLSAGVNLSDNPWHINYLFYNQCDVWIEIVFQ
jgi:hypothetical protein